MELRVNKFWSEWSQEEREAVAEAIAAAADNGVDGALKGYNIGVLTTLAVVAIGGAAIIPAYEWLIDRTRNAIHAAKDKPDATDSE